MDLVTALANKEFIVAAASMAVNVALWRALQKERDERITDMRREHDRDVNYLSTIRDLKDVISALRNDFAIWRGSDLSRRGQEHDR